MEDDRSKEIHHQYRKYHQALENYVRRLIPEEQTAADIVQDVYLAYIESSRRKRIRRPRAWLHAVARNAVMDYLARKNRSSTSSIDSGIVHAQFYSEIHPHPNAEDLLRRIEEAEIFLTPMQREVFSLYYRDNRNVQFISEELGITEANAKICLHRARTRLRKILRADLQDYR